jgi:hypothetical protein
MTRKVVKKYRRLVEKTIKLINEMPNFNIISTNDMTSYTSYELDYKLTKIVIKNALTNNEIGIVIEPNDTSENIKKTILLRFNNLTNTQCECPICYDIIDNNCQIPCNKCGCYTCINCYINMFRVNNGILTCYSCKNELGVYHPSYMVDIAIAEITQKYNLYTRFKQKTQSTNKNI